MGQGVENCVDNVSRRVLSHQCQSVAVKGWIICMSPLVFMNVYVVMIISICVLSWLAVELTQCDFCASTLIVKGMGSQTSVGNRREQL